MPKKTKSKARLDKYYYLAKEHGYRSRAAFKLIQLNQKYDFLSKAVCLVDLCAAPGGWLQVATKYMPLNSIKIGVDLVAIKNVPGCVTFQADITTPKCLALIKREIKHVKADVVLHDGAPNVGAQWAKDAYTQSELVLSSLKLATQLLRSGGIFVTKVFRSKDYATLLTVFKKLFKKVVATKPKASREASAEIFVVCSGYNAPSVVEPQLLDPKVVFNDSAPDKKDIVVSLKQLLEEKRHRSGYHDDGKGFVYDKIKLSEFVKAVNPFQTLKDCTEFIVDDEARKYMKKAPVHADIEQLCKDIKVLGKGELNTLLKWRTKVLHELAREKKQEEEALQEEAVKGTKEAEKVEPEKPVDEEAELDKLLAEREKQEKKSKKKLEERMAKRKVKYRDGQFAGEDNLDEDLGFDELLDEGEDLEEVGYVSLSDTDNEIERQGFSVKKSDDEADEVAEQENESEDDDDDDKRIQKMNKEMEEQYLKEAEENTLKRKIKKKLKRFKEDENEEDADEKLSEDMEDIDEENEKGENSAAAPDSAPSAFVNPLKAKINEIVEDKAGPPTEEPSKNSKKRAKPEKSKEGDSDEENPDEPAPIKKEKSERDLRKEKKRKQRERLEAEGKVHNGGFEEVPAEFDEGMDSDAIAETIAIGKMMLRKKNREQLIDASYNRYAFDDNKSDLPVWFVEDEEKHNKPQLPVTKEMIEAEKAQLKEFDAKTPKKVLEARARKKMKIARKLEKLKQKAQVIANQEDISEASKFRQIEKMYKKEKATKREEKKYVIAKSFNSSKRMKKHGKNVRFVDRRMKKDIRAERRAKKKSRGFKGHGGHRGKKKG